MLTKYGREKEKIFQALITFSYKIILSVTHNTGEKIISSFIKHHGCIVR